MKTAAVILPLALIPGLAHASVGLTGIDAFTNKPFCATACFGSLSSYRLDCSVVHGDPDDHHAHVMTSPECRADNAPFLTSLAWCIKTKCDEVDNLSTAEVEAFWEKTTTGDPAVEPMWSYRQALANITEPPVRVLGHGETINSTVTPPFFWTVLYDTWSTLHHEGWNMNVFGLIILNVGFALPILFTWLGHLPYINILFEKLRPYLVYPSLISTYHTRPLPFHLGNAPTIGQALYIALLVLLNVVLSAVNYKTTDTHLWFQNRGQQITGYLMYRTGVLSFAMAPLLILFAGRNNFLQWLTDWPHSTFLLLHRWVARLFALQALLHTVLAVAVYRDMGIYAAEAKLAYWAWGVVATLLACVMVVASALCFRRRAYEAFLLGHVVMAAVVLVACWYHVVERFPVMSGFTVWLWTASAVWFFDRLARVLRMARAGARRATVTELGEGYLRVDVAGVRWGTPPGQKVYVYFPTVRPLRPWENHPFSVIPSAMLAPPRAAYCQAESEGAPQGRDIEKSQAGVRLADAPEGRVATPGITLLIRRSAGMTRHLQSHEGLLTLLDGPYRSTSPSSVLRSDRLVLIAGGIGITSILPWTKAHPNLRLCWTVKESASCLVQTLEGALQDVAEKQIQIGARTDVESVLTSEVKAGWERIGVVVCGPGGLCDLVRAQVAAAGRREKTVFELEVDAYSW